MAAFNLPEKLNVSSGNLAENWRFFEQALTIYLTASGFNKADEERQVAILLNVIGEDGIKIYNNFNLASEEVKKFQAVKDKFHEYCEPKTNVLHSRFLFYSRKQETEEPFDSFLTDVKRLVKDCKFKSDEEAVRDRLVLGTKDLDTQKQLILAGDAELEAVVTKFRLAEIGRQQAADVQGGVKEVNKIENIVLKCKWCGQRHERRLSTCPARGKQCTKCNKYNHFASVCKNKFVKVVENSQDSDEEYYCGVKKQGM